MKTMRDPVFPGLAVALDPDRVRELLLETLPECREGLGVEEVKIYQVQYRPRKRCSILYSVKFRKPNGGRSRSQMLSAELLPAGESPREISAELVGRYRASGDRPLRHPVVQLPPAGLVAFAFPFDPALPSLVDACDERLIKSKLGRMWKDRGVRMRRVSVRSLGYTPGARAALLYESLGECRVTGLPEMRRIVGKLDFQRDAAEIFARGWAVWKEARQRFRMAPPVGFVAHPNLSFQEFVDGTRLSDLAGTGDFISPVRQAARAVALLHEMPLPLRFRRASLQSVKVARRWAKVLSAIRPDESKRIRALRDGMIRELELRATVTGPIHGDLHPSNLLVDDGLLTLIDLDNLVLGDRLLDVGRFLSALRTSSLRVHGRPDGLADAGESFLEQYLRQTGEDERRARLFEAAALLTSAGTGFRLQREGWEETAEWLLDECERVFALSGGAVGPARPSPPDAELKRRDAASDARRGVDRIAWACDEQYLRGLLDPHVRRVYDAELGECRAEPKGPKQRREHFRYRLSGWRGDQRWRIVLDGFLWQGKSGRSQSERLEAAYRSLERVDDAPLLPRPVAFLRELGLYVVEQAEGINLLELLEAAAADGGSSRNGALELIERCGRSLAALHAAAIEPDRSRSVEDEYRDLHSAVEKLARTDGALHRIAAVVLDHVEPVIAGDLARRAPALRHLSPRHVLLAGERIAVHDVDDIVAAHPLLDAAEFLVRLRVAPIDVTAAPTILDRFRRGYLNGTPDDAERLAAFEAVALVRAACSARRRDPEDRLAGELLRLAEERAEVCALEGSR